jgi:hypothetical protein
LSTQVDDDDDYEGTYVCLQNEVKIAMEDELVSSPNEFLLVQGFCAWEKEEGAGSGGIVGQLLNGNFETVARPQDYSTTTERIWDALKSQTVLSEKTLSQNFDLTVRAWESGKSIHDGNTIVSPPPPSSQEEDDPVVYDSSVSVSELADKALWHWISIFILGHEYYDYLT